MGAAISSADIWDSMGRVQKSEQRADPIKRAVDVGGGDKLVAERERLTAVRTSRLAWISCADVEVRSLWIITDE
jgi:hypothetical protein